LSPDSGFAKNLFVMNARKMKQLTNFLRVFGCFMGCFYFTAMAQTQPLVYGWQTKLASDYLSECRTINIYLPENYHQDDSSRYMTVYLPDGGTAEDFYHLSALLRYLSQPWIKLVPPAIVVGIENTQRRRDFTFAVENLDFLKTMGIDSQQFQQYGGSANYIRFLSEELMPYIQKNYRTNGQQMLIGESLAGLLATEILLKHTALFQYYVIISPSLWWGDVGLLQQSKAALNRLKLHNQSICIVVPDQNEDEHMFAVARELQQFLKAYPSKQTTFIELSDETHATVLHEAVYRAMKTFYQPK
jgi:predicted alpha/beta superfamily hydrolase